MAARAAHDLGIDPIPILTELANAVSGRFPARPSSGSQALTDFVADYLAHGAPGSNKAPEPIEPGSISLYPTPTEMGPRRWPVVSLGNTAALCRFLQLTPADLAWYADARSYGTSKVDENLQHYDYRWHKKQTGGSRLIEAPKQNLKDLQRRVLRHVLDHVAPHESAHGFRQGHSIHSYAAPHVGQYTLIKFDLRDFFATVPVGRVRALFVTLGYPDDVARSLQGLCTNAVPTQVLKRRPGAAPSDRLHDQRLRGSHLPQGAPSSPALANLAAYSLDRRLTGLAKSFGARYTRYADDLAISGDATLFRQRSRLIGLVREVVRDEGFGLNERKTKIRRRDQRQALTGLVVNDRLNTHRRDYDQLRAILHDAARNGPVIANRTNHRRFREHLEGRISFVHATNSARGHKLWILFDRIDW